MIPPRFTRSARTVGLCLAAMLIFASSPAAFAQVSGTPGGKVDTEAVFVISAGALNARSGPGVSFVVAKVLPRGHEVHIYERRGDWGRISKANEPARWVYTPLVIAAKSPVTRPQAPVVVVAGPSMKIVPAHGHQEDHRTYDERRARTNSMHH